MNMVTSCTFVMSCLSSNSFEKKLNIYIKKLSTYTKRSSEIMRIPYFLDKIEPFSFFNWQKSNKFLEVKTL